MGSDFISARVSQSSIGSPNKFNVFFHRIVYIPVHTISVTLFISAGFAATANQITVSNPSSNPQATYADDDSLLCYIVTPDGRTLNLNHLCGTNVDRPRPDSARTDSSNRSSVTSPIQQTPGCVVFDANGRPCP
jgi:hypothetical protein